MAFLHLIRRLLALLLLLLLLFELQAEQCNWFKWADELDAPPKTSSAGAGGYSSNTYTGGAGYGSSAQQPAAAGAGGYGSSTGGLSGLNVAAPAAAGGAGGGGSQGGSGEPCMTGTQQKCEAYASKS